jgi:hypothetical protein
MVKKEGIEPSPSFLNKNQLGKVEAPIKEWCSAMTMLQGVFTISTFPLHSRNV